MGVYQIEDMIGSYNANSPEEALLLAKRNAARILQIAKTFDYAICQAVHESRRQAGKLLSRKTIPIVKRVDWHISD